nr:hypothetical protein HUO10_003640 [Paraburkholderia busanensis]
MKSQPMCQHSSTLTNTFVGVVANLLAANLVE